MATRRRRAPEAQRIRLGQAGYPGADGLIVDGAPNDVGVPRQPESIPGSEEAMVTSLCHRLRFLGGWEKRGLGGAGRGSHTVA